MQKVKKTFMVTEAQDEWLRDVKEERGIDQSFVVRRALAFYKQHGMDKDSIMQKRMRGEL